MISKFALTALLALAVGGPVQEAMAQDAVGGAIVGGVLGGVVGGALGGGRGAAAGAIIGAGTGAAIAAQGEPSAGQRSHWYPYETTLPDQLPGSAIRLRPTPARPMSVGGARLAIGWGSVTTGVGSETAVAAPPGPRAVTATRSVCPRSAATTAYVGCVAPAICVQLQPVGAHRRHR